MPDQAVFDVMRSLADVVLLGAATAHDEGYRLASPRSSVDVLLTRWVRARA